MNRTEKQTQTEQLHALFTKAQNAYVVEFSGLTVEQDTALRAKVRASRSQYKVIKNTLAARAAKDTPMEDVASFFQGPTAVAVNDRDPVALAKIFKEFAGENPSFKVKAVVLSGKAAPAETLAVIASMPSREQLLTNLVSAMQQPVQKMAGVMAAAVTKFALALEALKQKKSSS